MIAVWMRADWDSPLLTLSAVALLFGTYGLLVFALCALEEFVTPSEVNRQATAGKLRTKTGRLIYPLFVVTMLVLVASDMANRIGHVGISYWIIVASATIVGLFFGYWIWSESPCDTRQPSDTSTSLPSDEQN
ncbi:MAG: hypothetical protein ACK4RK_21720 [Gemmataceae bacterium]